ncbi:response regulator receiver and ANTAR domain protein [Desulfotomaculum arcticum]|uniref:Stage 0 sporulation protein A homolog n=1 Tax=Desulfotruncus arcticus DSM 17038 TaxID=1121424 RepID=A0A1I2NAP3_9FIRM|nr:ANTAR domain-containing protein [Desulfotruncus arcticus]SFF98576.1 response regulator receiver and ANTAR domain protein [Desulfotomaculum arcticum] [Desulfotruncus arcticus DSM 17038]
MSEHRIVLVGADTMWRKNVKAMLSKYGYWVVGEAGDGVSALKMVRSRQPDLLIIDAALQSMDGFQVAKIVNEDKLAPVIATADASFQGVMEKAKEAKVFSLLFKPIIESSLLPAIELALTNYQEIASLEKQIKELQDTLETRKLVERAKGILTETLGLTEAEAFRRMQRQSMNKRVSMRVIAEAVIMSQSLKTKK